MKFILHLHKNDASYDKNTSGNRAEMTKLNGRMTPRLFTEKRQTESNLVITYPTSALAKCNKGLSKAYYYT